MRSEFLETLESYPQYKVYFVDKCGLDRYLYREYGYAPKGMPVRGKKFRQTNIVAAKCGDKIIAPMIYESTSDSILLSTGLKNHC